MADARHIQAIKSI